MDFFEKSTFALKVSFKADTSIKDEKVWSQMQNEFNQFYTSLEKFYLSKVKDNCIELVKDK